MILQMRPEYRLTQVLILTCALLAGAIFVEWYAHQRDADELNERLAAIDGKAGLSLDSRAKPDISLPPLDDYSEMVDRPLFIPGRKPLPETKEEQTAGTVDDDFTEKLQAQLMGVVSTPEGMTLLFVDSKGKYRRARASGEIEGWEIKEVEMDRVVLERGGATEVLLLRKPKPKTPAKAAAARKNPPLSRTNRVQKENNDKRSRRDQNND